MRASRWHAGLECHLLGRADSSRECGLQLVLQAWLAQRLALDAQTPDAALFTQALGLHRQLARQGGEAQVLDKQMPALSRGRGLQLGIVSRVAKGRWVEVARHRNVH